MGMGKLLIGLLLMVPPTAHAQDFAFVGDQAISMGSATLMQVMNNNILDPRLRRGGTARQDIDRRPRAGIAIGNGSTLYTPTVAVRREVEGEIVARLRKGNPAAAAALAEQVRRHDFAAIYRSLTAPLGLRGNDVGDILTAYTTLGYLIATDAADPSPAAVRGLRAQMAPRLAADPRFASASVRAKLGEELKIMFVTLHAGWQSARKEGNARRYSDGVAGLFRASEIDLRALRLTNSGVAAR